MKVNMSFIFKNYHLTIHKVQVKSIRVNQKLNIFRIYFSNIGIIEEQEVFIDGLKHT